VLTRLLRDQLRPYQRPLALVVLLQLVQTLATLYLPTLNADIIDKGVITGDTGYIIHTGGVMLAVALVQIVCAAALTPIITRVLGLSAFGTVTSANAVMQVLFVFAGLGLQTAVQREYSARANPRGARQLVMLAVVFVVVISASRPRKAAAPCAATSVPIRSCTSTAASAVGSLRTT